ncbi:MAG: phosphonate ABC transporter ATP-binding protein [Candidatus Velthaea sp.]
MLEIRALRVVYALGTPPALDGVALDVAPGECVALVGPSGSGKTTLLRTINGTVAPAFGTIRVDGVDVTALRGGALRELRGRIAVIAQHHDLVDRLTVVQNVMAGALGRWSTLRALRFLVAPTAGEIAEARAALSSVGIGDKLRSRTSEISGGQRQRVAVARALVQRPAAILADEPIASLDAELGEQIVALLCSLARERRIALVCSLHQAELARRHFDRVVELVAGRVRSDRRMDRPPRSAAACAG